MLQKGIIETIEDKYTVKVRVPKYDKIDSDSLGTKTEDLATGIVCTLPGMNLTYAVGDIVLVSFENDELSKPVILGLLYREQESDSVLEINGIDSSIDSINDKLDEISAQNLYTHIKYSNDNGMTFTSLYDPTQIVETLDYTIESDGYILIDPSVEYIYWNIIDSNNVDVTDSIPIVTQIRGIDVFKGIDERVTYQTTLMELPLKIKTCKEVRLSFTISLSKEQAKNYYISLTTDKNSIGSVYGDYIGISTSTDVVPSNNTKDYSWSSVTARNDMNTDKVYNDLLKRIQANEKDIRGYDEDDKSIDSGIGLLEAINISLDNIVVGLNRRMIYLGKIDNYVNTDVSELGINTITQHEFQLTRELQQTDTQSVPHLILYYID